MPGWSDASPIAEILNEPFYCWCRAETHASQTLSFDLLGPVRAWLGNAELNLGSPQQRSILVMLLLREGAVATLEELIEGMWGYYEPGDSLQIEIGAAVVPTKRKAIDMTEPAHISLVTIAVAAIVQKTVVR